MRAHHRSLRTRGFGNESAQIGDVPPETAVNPFGMDTVLRGTASIPEETVFISSETAFISEGTPALSLEMRSIPGEMAILPEEMETIPGGMAAISWETESVSAGMTMISVEATMGCCAPPVPLEEIFSRFFPED
ncbi:MAG TPA: hypothetical protein VEL74_11695 [Thermoanaerobaculia bacterium]|nr:hypothetical protein [Thermoanaerobaculia bacterium]